VSELLTQAWQDLIAVVLEWDFVNLAAALVVILVVGTGLWRMRYRGIAWGIALGALWAALHTGVGREEWGEVLFNGTLL
jgi:hypothetical protein